MEPKKSVNGSATATERKSTKVVEQYKKINQLGTGAFGTAFLCEGSVTKQRRVVK